MKTFLTHSNVLLIAAALVHVTGCAPVAPRLDAEFGKSLNTLKAYQTINPHASSNTENPAMDGRTAKDAIDSYHKSFAAPVPFQNVFTIGVGSGNR